MKLLRDEEIREQAHLTSVTFTVELDNKCSRILAANGCLQQQQQQSTVMVSSQDLSTADGRQTTLRHHGDSVKCDLQLGALLSRLGAADEDVFLKSEQKSWPPPPPPFIVSS